jgi:putative DNA primase/helicase
LHGQKLGCIVGIMTDPVTAQPTGAISRTYIGPDCKKVCKAKTLGEGGGVIRLSHDEDALHGLFLGEGKETCLAAAALGLRPIWVTGSATTMAKFPLVAGIESLTLIADHDANGAGERAAREVETRWIAAGREVRILRAKAVGYDLNDALKRA